MNRRLLAILAAVAFATGPVFAQDPQTEGQTKADEAGQVSREETVIVSASKVETTLVNAPATVSVVSSETIDSAPSTNFGDLLRNVPGVNVIQTSARDINLSSRVATSTLATSQLVLLDGRSLYLDFFGLVLWDLVPTNANEIKQIEVVRGPASAVWGANALSGVVNIITKSPRESQGVNLTFSGGKFSRDAGSRKDDGSGTSYGLGATIAKAPNDKISFRLAAGYFNSDPYSRPIGTVPVATHPLDSRIVTGGAPYPADVSGQPGAFENAGTSQPKFEGRLDQELGNGGRMTYSAGYAGTEGIVHTGIGPFDLQSGSYLGYGKIGYSKGALKIASFVNFLDAEAPNLLLIDPATGNPVQLNFTTQTYDFEIGHSRVLGGAHILSYGGNARRNNFDITLTPNAENRNEFGAYFQEEYFKDRFRISLGARADKFGNIDDVVFSPRITVMFKPAPDHALRASFNKAFRSPSAVNNFLDQKIFAPPSPQLPTGRIDLRPLLVAIPRGVAAGVLPPSTLGLLPLVPRAPFGLVVNNIGNPNLKEESVKAYELSYTGSFGDTTLGLAVYQNDTDDNINFTSLLPGLTFPTGGPGFELYTPANSAETGIPGPLYAFLLATRTAGFPLPRTVSTYLNLGPLRQQGLEASLDQRINNVWSFGVNYSYQKTPEILDPASGQIRYPIEEVGIPAKNRFNANVNWAGKRVFGTVSANYVDKAFWTDVLTAPFHGATDSYTMLNASVGVRWADGKVTTMLKGTNLANETIQQHVFGDILKRSIMGEVRLQF
jgi:outer membrane receptor protein involved in Fe transport